MHESHQNTAGDCQEHSLDYFEIDGKAVKDYQRTSCDEY